MGAGQSSFVILYHRTPFDESKDKNGKRIWVDQKSPNGIIPTLRNLFRSCEKGTWIAWRRVDDQSNEGTERFEMDNPSPFTLCRIPLEDEQISSFLSHHIQRMLLANTSYISNLFQCQQRELEDL